MERREEWIVKNFIIFLIIVALLISILIFFEHLKKTKENFTELYFEDYSSLPRDVSLNETYSFSFVVRNLENKDMNYEYKIVKAIFRNKSEDVTSLKKKTFKLQDKESRTFNETITIKEKFDKAKISIHLFYDDDKKEEIYFWIFER
jgi:hypothetical protein